MRSTSVIAEEYEFILARTGCGIEVIDRKVRWMLVQEWRQVYAIGLHAARGRWKRGQYEWHVFSFRHCPALSGKKATAAYLEQHSTELIVCPETERLNAIRLKGTGLPDFRALGEDIYVWPVDVAWTMAFTHEFGLGPYFSRLEWAVSTVEYGDGRAR